MGYEEEGQLTKRLKKTPNAVVLLDEVEKAHPDVLGVCLQLFDEGHVTDGKGQKVECKDAIFIMTSNLAQREIAENSEKLREDIDDLSAVNATISQNDSRFSKQFMDHELYPILRKHFGRDEFLGRINDILIFLPFSEGELKNLVKIELEIWKTRAMERHEMLLKWDDKVIDELAKGYNIHYGARSIHHEIEKKVVSQIAKAHENDEIDRGSEIELGVDASGHIKIKTRKGKPSSPSSVFSFFDRKK